MKPDIRPAETGTPAIHSPELQRFVDAARAQRLPPLAPVSAGFDRMHAGFQAARAAQTRRRAAYGGLALAAGLAALVLTRVDLGPTRIAGPEGHVAQDMSQEPAANTAVPRAPMLAPGVRVVADADTPSPTVLGPWEVGLAPGRYAVEVDEHPGPELLRARSQGGTVELHHGRVEIVVAGSATEASLREGVATWVAADGTRRELAPVAAPTPDEPAAPPEVTDGVDDPSDPQAIPGQPDVRLLARRADELLTAGKRGPAIRVLTQIVTQHRNTPAARGALLDLAPLLKADGRVDEARCAYRLYLDRYPGKPQLADEVEKALARLGDGPECRGLRPK